MNVQDRIAPSLTPAEFGHGPVPTAPYRCPKQFELEREHIFKKTWMLVGREEDIPNVGDYVLREVEVCNASALLVRGKDGEIRAFHNVCPHRSNKIVWDAEGSERQFSCKYHGWTFELDGQLRGAPDSKMFFNFDKKNCGLKKINVQIWEGFIFLNFAEKPRQTLVEYLGGMGEKFTGYPFHAFSAYGTIQATYDANWKVCVDAFQESYHVAALHRRTIGPQLTSVANPFGRMISAEFFGPHRSGSGWGNRNMVPRPIEATAFEFTKPIGLADNIEELPDSMFPKGLNPTNDPDWAVDVNIIFPNTMLFAGKQGFVLHNFWPIAHNKTRWEARVYQAPPKNARQLFAEEVILLLFRDTFIEDGINVAKSQEGINSGVMENFQFQDNEVLLRHQHVAVERMLQEAMNN